MRRFFSRSILVILLLLISFSSAVVLAEDLPAQYDLRDLNGRNYVTPVKFQNPWGTCWSFAANSVVETSSLLKKYTPGIDLSERSLAWFNSRMLKVQGSPDDTYEGFYTLALDQNTHPGVDIQSEAAFNNGGTPVYALNQFSTWYGGNSEKNAPYQNDEGNYTEMSWAPGWVQYTPQGNWKLPYNYLYEDYIHLNEGFVVTVMNDPASHVDTIKRNILNYGSANLNYITTVSDDLTFNPETAAMYVSGETANYAGGHAVTIVGWDDDYAVSNFVEGYEPPAPGAWIIKNSWTTEWGDEGYFYLSYYSVNVTTVVFLDAETRESGFTYDNNYQYDLLGGKNAEGGTGYFQNYLDLIPDEIQEDDIKYANIFTAKRNETLEAVSCYNYLDTAVQYTTQIYLLNDNYTDPTDGELVSTVTNTVNYQGFYTVPLETTVDLPAGTVYSVVQQQKVEIKFSETDSISFPFASFEIGYDDLKVMELQGPTGEIVNFSLTSISAVAQPGETFIYSNGIADLNGWYDISDPTIEDNPLIYYPTQTYQATGEVLETYGYIGNALIKAFTVNNDDIIPEPLPPEIETITVTAESEYLSTLPGNINSTILTASYSPEDAYLEEDFFIWTCSPAGIVDLESNGLTAKVTALQEGEVFVMCSRPNIFAGVILHVTNNQLVVDSIDITSAGIDSFSVTAKNVRTNPALIQQEPVERVSIFSWSEPNQSDINAKVADRIPGTNDWTVENIPINETPINNYFLNADDILIHVYADTTEYRYYLGNSYYDWTTGFKNDSSQEDTSVAYITYGQNVGFVRPPVFQGSTSGIFNLNNSQHLEGLRVSSGIDGIEINTRVYARGLGWLLGVNDGVYAGTMWQNRPIEAISLTLSGAGQFVNPKSINYRVYVADQGWTEWGSNGEEVGAITGSSRILAVEISITDYE